MGTQAYQEMLAKEKISKDVRLNAMLKRVGQRIAAQTPANDFQWEFRLIESPEMNAFCLPGGKVAFYTGILPVLENEAAMAVVMGHEVAHAIARHGGQRMSQGLLVQGGLAVVDVGLLQNSKYRNLTMGLLGVGASVGVMLPFSRSHESEADELGLRYAAAAGYDPAEAARFWQRFSQKGGSKPPEFLSTHPSDSTRIENLGRLETQVRESYETSPKFGLGEKI